jgi:hypothetical protein
MMISCGSPKKTAAASVWTRHNVSMRVIDVRIGEVSRQVAHFRRIVGELRTGLGVFPCQNDYPPLDWYENRAKQLERYFGRLSAIRDQYWVAWRS